MRSSEKGGLILDSQADVNQAFKVLFAASCNSDAATQSYRGAFGELADEVNGRSLPVELDGEQTQKLWLATGVIERCCGALAALTVDMDRSDTYDNLDRDCARVLARVMSSAESAALALADSMLPCMLQNNFLT